MKKYKVFLCAVLAVFGCITAVFYTSCKKDPQCSSICLNGSSCVNGSCRCLSGYYGSQCQYTQIVYQNNTQTSVKLSIHIVHGTTDASARDTVMYIAAHTTAAYYGIPALDTFKAPGDTVYATAYTYGPFGPTGSSHDVLFGESITWSPIKTGFTKHGTVFVAIDVRPDYFFVQVINNNVPPKGSLNVIGIDVNNTLLASYDTIQNTSGAVPLYYGGAFAVVNDSLPHNVGYFGSAFASTVTTTDATGYVITHYCSLPFTWNQVYVMTIP